tara:strand:+ start:600 stop:1256 length:657 start_codon:yes stop_codon:yes gene_type:complete
MHKTIQNLNNINKKIQSKILNLNYKNYHPKIIAVSKTFDMDNILPLIDYGHEHYGENKIQEAIKKWTNIKKDYPKVKLHLLGKVQTNKVKFILPLFDYIHSLDNIKLAKKISDEQKKKNFKPKIFIQINLANESQKSGIDENHISDFYHQCINLDLNIIGIMCLPPINEDPIPYFSKMNKISNSSWLTSMGMSSDYLDAVEYKSSFLRIGSSIFGRRV